MRDDDLDSMTAEEFRRKYDDSLTEIKAQSKIRESFSGGNASSLIHPEDKNIDSRPWKKIPGKNKLEKIGYAKQQENTKGYIYDAIEVRKKEILDPNEMPMTKLLDIAVKLMPSKVEGEIEHKFSYGEMVMKAAKNLEAIEDAAVEEAELIEEA